jgi:DNA-binding NtrC family response regulator
MISDRNDPLELLGTPMVRFQHGVEGFRLRMTTTRWTIGRGAACDVRLPRTDGSVSRRHLVLQRRGRRVLVSNLGRHAARLNGRRLGERAQEVQRGDVVHLGCWKIGLEDEVDAPASTAPPPSALQAPSAHGLVGAGAAIGAVRDSIDRFASLRIPVLILGETGSGKERVARALHAASSVSVGPFVPINCGTLIGDTARSEIFGHVKGAFTGADRPRPGAFVDADGGTLFLDEIGELTLDMQAALLRTLDLGEVVPVGATKAVKPRVRVLAATHRDLPHSQRFRQDLLYRLDVACIEIPPLRDRVDDIAPLANHFLDTTSLGISRRLTPAAENLLRAHPWPGNVRELRNCMLRAAVLCDGRSIGAEHITLRPVPSLEPALPPRPTRPNERLRLMSALVAADGNRTMAAQSLGIARSTLYERLRKYGIE